MNANQGLSEHLIYKTKLEAKDKRMAKVSKPYSIDEDMVKKVDRHAAELTLATGKKVASSKIVQDALKQYFEIAEADGVVKVKKGRKS